MLEANREEIVYQLPVERVCALQMRGALPLLPPHVEAWNQRRFRRPVTIADFAALTWFGFGRVDESGTDPSAIMAFYQRFDHHTTSESLEVVHIAGSARGMRRLIQAIVRLGQHTHMTVSGELDVENARMMKFIANAGFWPERARFTHPAGDAT